MKNLFLGFSCLLAASLSANGQSTLPATTIFTNYWWNTVPPAQAVYRIQRLETPGQSRLDSVFFLASNHLMRVSSTRWQPNGDTLTTTTNWRASGKLLSIENTVGYRLNGEYRAYDTNGDLKLTAQYERGRQLRAECFTQSGTTRPCTATEYTEKMPLFPGGTNDVAGNQQRLLRYIGQHLRYPAEALQKQQQGVVIVNFIVSETGEVRDVWVGTSSSKPLANEAIRVVQGMPRWVPGEQDGEPVPVQYYVPVTFSIR